MANRGLVDYVPVMCVNRDRGEV